MKALRKFNEWMFGWGSPVSLAVFRIVISSLSALNLLLISPFFEVWFTSRGHSPPELIEQYYGGVFRLSVLGGGSGDTFAFIVFWGTFLVSVLSALGLWSRVSVFLMFLGVVTLHHRNMDILHSGDTLMRNAMFFLIFAPSGDAISLDRLIRLWKGEESGPPPECSLWPQRCLQIQLAILYLTTVWHKAQGTMWRDGTATYVTYQLREFERFPIPEFLTQAPMIQVQTWATLLIELAMATLVFAKPFRKWVMIAAVMLHLGIEYTMNIPLFAFIIMSLFVLHFEGKEITAWVKRRAERIKKPKIVLPLPGDPHPARAEALQAMDPLERVEPKAGEGSIWAAFLRMPGAWIFSLLGILWPQQTKAATTAPTASEKKKDAATA